MALILEDGTGTVVGANSYGADAGLVAYWADRGVTIVQAQPLREASLIKATDYLDRRFRWVSCKLLPETQPLQWPRVPFWFQGRIIEGLPVELVKACYEYAFRDLSAPLAPDPTVDASGVAVTRKREKVGPIEVETAFSGGSASSSTWKPYPVADALLRGLYVPEGQRVYRA